MNKNELKNLFGCTYGAMAINNEIASINEKIRMACKKINHEYNVACDKITGSIPYMNRKYEELNKVRMANIKTVKAQFNDRLNELEAELNSKFENFSVVVAGNEAWNDIVHRKSVPQILAELEKSNLTEEQLELNINGQLSDSAKISRYGFPLKHLETLGWIKRTGTGNNGDAMVSHLTTEGKRQLDFYRTHKIFDSSEIADIVM